MPAPELLAIAAALCIAFNSMLISELKGRLPLLQLTRWQMIGTFAMTGAVSLVLGGWRTIGAWEFGMLALSSMFGIMLASTTYFATIYAVGPRITALLFSLTSPFALALGYVFLGETISPRQGLGVALVLAGVVLAVGAPRRFVERGAEKPPIKVVALAPVPLSVEPAPPVAGRLWPGILLGIVTAFGQALGTLFARPAMAAGVEPFTAMALRAGLAAVFFYALMVLPAVRAAKVPFEAKTFGAAIGSAFFGTTLGMSLMLAALHSGDVGIVSTLSSMTPVLVLPMVWFWTGNRPPAAAWVGALLAICGTALISID